MASDSPAAAEAVGQEYVEVTFGGARYRVPLDVDRWPLQALRACRTFNTDTQQVGVDHRMVVEVLRQVLGYDQLIESGLLKRPRGEAVDLSHALAEAVGIGGSLSTDTVFGAIPRLLAVLHEYPDVVESDLDQWWGIDYGDRWRYDGDGLRRLTLRKIHVRLSNLPRLASLARVFNGGKTPLDTGEVLLMDLWESQPTVRWQKAHPGRPRTAEEQAKVEAEAKQDAADREAAKIRHAARKNRQHIDNARANARAAMELEEANA